MTEQLGHYKILERIGADTLGETYRARDLRVGRTVALKVASLDIAADPDKRARLVADAQAAAALSHPNIAALYEVGEDSGRPFLAFEFVPGETLETMLAGGPLNPRHAAEHAIQIADALAEAHATGIVHGDLAPHNIVVTPKGSAKILNFGLAHWSGQDQAPATDHLADIFSFGVVLFEMLTGRRPPGHLPPVASAANPALRPDFDPIVARALARNPDDRYQAAATLAAELRSVAAILDVRTGDVEPASAARPRPVRPAPRKSRTPIFVGLVTLALVGAFVAMWLLRLNH
jgi:serine/threonine-protein kinase